MNQSIPCLDDSFGPTISVCRRGFDFTLLFEQSFLSVVPSSLFILISIVRLQILWAKPQKVGGVSLQQLKLVRSLPLPRQSAINTINHSWRMSRMAFRKLLSWSSTASRVDTRPECRSQQLHYQWSQLPSSAFSPTLSILNPYVHQELSTSTFSSPWSSMPFKQEPSGLPEQLQPFLQCLSCP